MYGTGRRRIPYVKNVYASLASSLPHITGGTVADHRLTEVLDVEITEISKNYQVRRLGRDDVDAIYELCRENRIFYRYHEPFVTKESILDDMEALPP